MAIKSYKGFKPDMTCRGFQFEVGKEFTHEGSAVACQAGFHACEYPLDVIGYYPPATSVYAEVEQDGDLSRDSGDSKVASSILRVKASLDLPGLIKAAIDYTFSRVKPAEGAASNSGYRGAASNSGYRGAASNSGTQGAASNSGTQGAASNSGTQGAASNSGDYGAASNSGDYGAASNSGTQGAASNSGYRGAATSSGYGGKVKGVAGSAIFLTERDDNGEIIAAAAAIVGKTKGIKPDTWYTLKRGKFVVAKD